MPSSPTMNNHEEDAMVRKTDDAWKYGLYREHIINALNDIIRLEDETWYQIIYKRYIERKRPLKVQMELKISHYSFNMILNEALLHLSSCCKMDTDIFAE